MKLEFSAQHLVIDNSSPLSSTLDLLFTTSNDKYSSDGIHYIIEKKSIDDNFYWIYARYGKEKPYTETVLNINNDLEEPNPRSTNQIEPDKQIFGLYVVNQATFYLSSVRKKAFLKNTLHHD